MHVVNFQMPRIVTKYAPEFLLNSIITLRNIEHNHNSKKENYKDPQNISEDNIK